MSRSIVRKVLNRRYTFLKSKKDMEMLRGLREGTADMEKLEGGWDFNYYAAVFNISTEFGEQMLNNIPDLDAFNNRVVDAQEEYMPSYPPMSSVTNSFFSAWLFLDAPVSDRLTLGTLYSRYIHEKKVMQYARQAMENLNNSHAGFYQVSGTDGERLFLWDIVGTREIEVRTTAKYQPSVDEVWYTRLLPSLRGEDCPHITFSTPLIFRNTGRKQWEEFFARRSAASGGDPQWAYRYLKRGEFFAYWLEFVLQTYAGYTDQVVFAEGVPDMAHTRPCGDCDGGRLS